MRAFIRKALHLAAFVTASLLPPHIALAAVVYTVDSVLDDIDDDVSDSICHTGAGTCTLRAAVMQANRASGAGVTIVLPAGTYTLTRFASGADGDDNGDLNLTTPASGSPVIAISGAGAANTIIDANQIDRILTVGPSRSATIAGVTLQNGYETEAGGAIRVSGAQLAVSYSTIRDSTSTSYGGGIYAGQNTVVTLNHVIISGNKANVGGGILNSGYLEVGYCTFEDNQTVPFFGMEFRNGGAIASYGDLRVTHSSFVANSASYGGGGIVAGQGGTVLLSLSTFTGNSATAGGAIFGEGGPLTMIEDTISSNSAVQSGGGIYNLAATVNIYNSTIADNQAALANGGSAGGIYNDPDQGGVLNLRNSVVARNYLGDHAAYNDCTGVVGIYGNNKFWTTAGCFADAASTGSGTFLDSLDELGPLQDNGGPTLTHAIVTPSAMIDGSDAAGCVDNNGDALPTDQRDAPRVAGLRCDIGAFEYGSLPNWIFADGFD